MSLSLKIFNLIQGTWKISRKIPGTGFLNGQAKFERNQNDLNKLFYSENGVFHFDDGKSLEATKKYIYHYLNDDIHVYFNEKNNENLEKIKNNTDQISSCFFHKFGIANSQQEPGETKLKLNALHLCINDEYRISYEFDLSNTDRFSITYDVKGPKKDYSSHTIFTRISNFS